MTGLGKFDPKQRREQRRRNHIARDLRTPKYRQRVVEDHRESDEERRWRRYHHTDEED
jgi:hypothetical protein